MVMRSSIEATMIDGVLWVKMEGCVNAIRHARDDEKRACYQALLTLHADTESHAYYLHAAERLKAMRGIHGD